VQQNPDFPIEEETETQSTIPYVWSCTSQDTQRWSEREEIFAYNSRDAGIRSW
jgi:hypothetical protein